LALAMGLPINSQNKRKNEYKSILFRYH
jgi:hypothetical protein